jgi:hypothetical protein
MWHRGGGWPTMVGIQFLPVLRSKRGRESTGAELVRVSEGGQAALQFGSI